MNLVGVLEVTKLLINMIHNTDRYEQYIEFVKDRPFNDQRYFITNQKLKNLGWEPTINFNSGIKGLL